MTVPKINSAHGSDTRNIINAAIDSINAQGKSIQDLVAEGQLTEEQYGELIKIVNSNLSKGEVSVRDIDKNLGKFDGTFFTNDFLEKLNNGTIEAAKVLPKSLTSEHYSDQSVFPKTTTFLSVKESDNIFNGEFSPVSRRGREPWVVGTSMTEHYVSAVVPIEHGKTYRITKRGQSDRFFVMTSEADPRTAGSRPILYSFYEEDADQGNTHTFKNYDNANFLAVQTSAGSPNYPEVEIVEEVSITFDESINFPFLEERENLFNGEFTSNLTINGANNLWYSDDALRKVAIVPIEENQIHSVTKKQGGDSFNIMLVDRYPDNQNTNYIEVPSYVYRGNQDGDVSVERHHSFKNETGASYLVVQTNLNAVNTPKVIVTKGFGSLSFSDEYLPDSILDLISKPEKESENEYPKKDAVYNFYANLNQLYRHELIDDFLSDPTGMSASEYHQMYEPLLQSHNDIFARTKLGEDDWDNPLYKYEIKPPIYELKHGTHTAIDDDYEDMKMPKIVMTAGVHGYERSVSYSMYYFFKTLLENPQDDELIEFIRTNVHFIGIPVACPSGFDDDTYLNRSGGNINRDFPPDGSEPSQTESKLIKAEIEDNLDMDFYVDFHNIQSNVRDIKIGYTITDNIMFAKTLNNMYRNIGRAWQKENPEFPQDADYVWAHNARGTPRTIEYFVDQAHGIDGGLMEIPNRLLWTNDGKFGESTVRMGVEFIVNAVAGLFRTKM